MNAASMPKAANRLVSVAFAAVLGFSLSACGAEPQATAPSPSPEFSATGGAITVLAAASLTEAFTRRAGWRSGSASTEHRMRGPSVWCFRTICCFRTSPCLTMLRLGRWYEELTSRKPAARGRDGSLASASPTLRMRSLGSSPEDRPSEWPWPGPWRRAPAAPVG